MKIRLGTRLCIIINSASIAKQVHKDHDTIFANRDITATASAAFWGGTGLVLSPHGEHWRMLRKICTRELLNGCRLDAQYDHRRREVRTMVNQIYTKINTSIDIGDQIFQTKYNLMADMLWGGMPEREVEMKLLLDQFRKDLHKALPLLIVPNISDLFPILAKFDIQGLARRANKLGMSFGKVFNFIIDQRLRRRDEEEKKDFLQVLIHLKDYGDEKTPFTKTTIIALLLDLLVAGTKSSSAVVEWAMTELLMKPKLMKKAQEEIDEVVGMNSVLEEGHCSKLNYINAIVKETLRLHPIAPILIPKYTSKSCTIGGYNVPKGTKIIVNAWAIQRDSTYWNNPLEFQPERFLGPDCEWGYNGENQNYIPFGSGRRVCVGISLAERMVPYLLASLLHSFNWKLQEGTQLDFSETFGLELTKTIPLIAIPSPRLSDQILYS
ncbi:hypothetical protein AQUCO_02800295v1 [Aquilegia coerulea]|uniref:Cytochrome P450 n=1 Tax=Aquilegia coerulea TaxID=218851 RepID=A0A2G5D4P7_AQUCA|nr:hypothetical protein AQUCO_02800295v1 [Aquilegia coerulea]